MNKKSEYCPQCVAKDKELEAAKQRIATLEQENEKLKADVAMLREELGEYKDRFGNQTHADLLSATSPESDLEQRLREA